MVTMQFYINSINSGRNQGQRQKGIHRIYGMYVSMLFPFGEFKPKFFSQLSWADYLTFSAEKKFIKYMHM